MKLESLREVINAAHLSRFIDEPFPERGGLMLVSPPGQLKTSIITFLEEYSSALVLSDLNNRTIIQMRDDILASRITTLAFEEFEKLYQRNTSIASNLEGHIKAFSDQGFRLAGFEDQRTPGPPARCMIVGCMTPGFFRRKIDQWKDSGFYRRFLWCHYRLKNPELIADAIERWERMDLGKLMIVPANRKITFNLTSQESKALRHMLRFQKHFETPFILLQKIACVLKWRHSSESGLKWRVILDDFAECLTKDGAELIL